MSSVYLCSPTNSQMFTTCCQTAICSDQKKCPSCKQYVYPFSDDMEDEEIDSYSKNQVDNARWSKAFRR